MPDSANPEYIAADKTGRLVLPPALVKKYGVQPGERVYITENDGNLQLKFPARLAKLYIEPTSYCNLDCRTCIRNTWKEPMGRMSEATFAKIIEGLQTFSPPPKVFFGGFGEPLFHPKILDMVAQAKKLGGEVELITNGTLLTKEISRELVKLGLDMLWVSLDGASPESYTDIRLGATLPKVLENLTYFHEAIINGGAGDSLRYFRANSNTKIGIAFVAMKRNIQDLPKVLEIGQRVDASRFMVTNVLPYSKDMMGEILYARSIHNDGYRDLSFPAMDVNDLTYKPIYEAIRKIYGTWAGINSKNARDRCPFLEQGAGAVSWDGSLSPCLPLMHSHSSFRGYLQFEERYSERWVVGNVEKEGLPEVWHKPEHIAFRERVQSFDFSPCCTCGSCELSEKNDEDCMANIFPTCGGCLWAQGVIQCP
jgi:MoaA/NifB/PqqE/SkfB family radical SAM enzyme